MQMGETVLYGGRTYHVQSSGRYYQSGVKTDSERLLHRRIWSDEHGPIPPGYVVHHIDGNWRHNDLSNLELRERSEHQSEHMQERLATPDGLAAQRGHLARARAAASEWHRSEEGRAWHSEKAKRDWETRDLDAHRLKCEACGDEFGSPVRTAQYCSSACQQRIGFRTYFTDKRTCAHCGADFMANRHRKTACCSLACANRKRAADASR